MEKVFTRRSMLCTAGAGLVAAPLMGSLPSLAAASAPTKPELVVDARAMGAVGDGVAVDTIALQRAVDRCAVLGGGEVFVPAGRYLTGALRLRSRVLVRLDKGAELVGSANMNDYPVTEVRWEGRWVQGHAALVYALDAEQTGVVGAGKITGCDALGGRPKADSPLRHPALMEFIRCRKVRLEDFTTSYHLMWSVHPTLCEDVAIRNLTIRSTGGNGDGIDVDSCLRVVIDGCDISSGDDCISLKSGRGMEGYTEGVPTEDVRITNCTFADANFACIGIGSETSGGIRRVEIRDCKFTGAKSHALYIKSRVGRGPFLEDLRATGLEVSGMRMGFLRINLLSSGIQDAVPVPGLDGVPTARNVVIENVKVTDVPMLVDALAVHPLKPVTGLVLSNITGTCRKGIQLAHMRGVTLRGIHVTGYEGPLLRTVDVTGTGLAGAEPATAPEAPAPIAEPSEPYRLG